MGRTQRSPSRIRLRYGVAVTIMSAKSSWFVSLRTRHQARIRLFCFPYAGGGVSSFREWPQLIPDLIDIAVLQLPGRDARYCDPPIFDIKNLVDSLVVEIGLMPYMPFVFFGHSLGALVSAELASRLHRDALPLPHHMIVSGCRPPHLSEKDSAPPERLTDDEFLKDLHRLQGTPKEVLEDAALMKLLLPTLRADFALGASCARESPTPLPCKMSTYGGLADPDVSPQDLTEWQHYSDQTVPVRLFRGGHFFLHSARADLIHMHATNPSLISIRNLGRNTRIASRQLAPRGDSDRRTCLTR